MIEIENKRVHDFIVAKDELVNEGRKLSRQLEDLEVKIVRLENKEKKLTAKAALPKELTDRGDELAKQAMAISDELDKVGKEIHDTKLATIPQEIKEEHIGYLKDREKLERERNKIALKVQKIKDKIIPTIQREVKPLLGEYDDIETAKTKDGKVIITIFNYLEDFKKRFAR